MEHIQLHTDGSSRRNPGPGGFGGILIFNDHVKEYSQGYTYTTNNRMELRAVIHGLSMLKTNKYPITIYTDSRYVIDSVSKGWLFNWIKTGFRGKKNKDLWLQYLEVSKNLNITFTWVKGHNGHVENERCDYLAVQAALSGDKIKDEGYI